MTAEAIFWEPVPCQASPVIASDYAFCAGCCTVSFDPYFLSDVDDETTLPALADGAWIFQCAHEEDDTYGPFASKEEACAAAEAHMKAEA